MNNKCLKQFALLMIALFVTLYSCDKENDTVKTEYIGITLPLTGESPLNIEAHQTVVEIAMNDLNNYFLNNNIGIKLIADIQNTHNSPEGMVSALNHFAENGIKYVASAGTSQTLSDARSTLNSFDGVMVHSTSTSTILSVSDNLFRIIPDDYRTAEEIAQKLDSDNIKEVIILYRDDVWGKQLSYALQLQNESYGFNVNLIGYEARFLPESLAPAVEMAEDKYSELAETTSQDEIAMVVLSFNEIDEVLPLAAEKENLLNIKWYGSDGYIMNNLLVENNTLAQIASEVGLFCPAIAMPDNNIFQDVQARVSENLGYTPRTNNLLVYDAVWAAGIACSKEYNSPLEALTEALSENHYIFGAMVMNEFGDRINCSYQYWFIAKEGENYLWKALE